MSIVRILFRRSGRTFLKHLPNIAVVAIVLFLLRGVEGTLDGIRAQFAALTASFLGTGEGTGDVILYTLPLASAAGTTAFLIGRRVLTFESFSTVLVVACIIVAGASFGGILRGLLPHQSVPVDAATFDNAMQPLRNALVPENDANANGDGEIKPVSLAVVNERPSLSELAIPTEADRLSLSSRLPIGIANANSSTEPSALEQLSDVDWLGQPDLSKIPRGEVRPLPLLPATDGTLGIVVRAVNQIFGYLTAYQLRLFLAAVIAGSWAGWTLHKRMDDMFEEANNESPAAGSE